MSRHVVLPDFSLMQLSCHLQRMSALLERQVKSSRIWYFRNNPPNATFEKNTADKFNYEIFHNSLMLAWVYSEVTLSLWEETIKTTLFGVVYHRGPRRSRWSSAALALSLTTLRLRTTHDAA